MNRHPILVMSLDSFCLAIKEILCISNKIFGGITKNGEKRAGLNRSIVSRSKKQHTVRLNAFQSREQYNATCITVGYDV